MCEEKIGKYGTNHVCLNAQRNDCVLEYCKIRYSGYFAIFVLMSRGLHKKPISRDQHEDWGTLFRKIEIYFILSVKLHSNLL